MREGYFRLSTKGTESSSLGTFCHPFYKFRLEKLHEKHTLRVMNRSIKRLAKSMWQVSSNSWQQK